MNYKTLAIATIAFLATSYSIYALFSGQSTDREQLKDFFNYKRKFNKQYTNKEDLEYRLSIFSQNMRYIARHNATNSSYKLGITQFTDMTFEEFKHKYLLQEPMINNLKAESEGEMLTSGIDWRTNGKVTEVKNQASCGSCWAFSTTGSLESAYAIFKDTNIELSEQELVDCSRSNGNYGCMGGLMSNAFDYVKENKLGIEADYPYKGQDSVCKIKTQEHRYVIKGYKFLSPVDVNGLMDAVNKQPVSVAIEVQQDFMHYKSGIYVNDHCGTHLNHGVLVVGYKTDVELPYFIVKNSWGTTWGDNGYISMKIGAGSGTCGIANNWDVYPEL